LGGIVGGTAGAMSKGVRSMRTASKKNIEANVNKEIERIKTLKNEQNPQNYYPSKKSKYNSS